MSSSLVGTPLRVVFTPLQLARFRELVGLGDVHVDVDVTGWNKYVLLAEDRAFLFPRQADNVEWFERELDAYRALESTGLSVVPRILGAWRDETVYPFPFAAVTRLRGRRPKDASRVLDQLGGAIAQWHELPPPDLPGSRPPAHHDKPAMRWMRRALDPDLAVDAAAEAADRLDRPAELARWTELLEAGARHRHVLVHGDIHEHQLLAVDGQLTGILDWETARIDHPFWDFDLGEWATAFWRDHRHEFSRLWSVMWRAYAHGRDLDADPAPLEAVFRLRQALSLTEDARDPQVVGTIDEHLDAI